MADNQSEPSKQRTLVLCFDGTTNQYGSENTNVVRFFSLLKKDDSALQLCYYQPGVGTYFQPGVVSPLFEWCAKILDEAVAWYLNAHVMEGYNFLMQNYRTGDKICIFGFSRGAYTARALAGFLHKIGLLSRDNVQQVPFAFKLYQRTDTASEALCSGFKQTYCRDVKIDFIGVWDTVASVGVISGRTLPFITSNKAVRTFRHACSLDERRCKFRPNLFHRPAPSESGAKNDPEHASPVVSPTTGKHPDVKPNIDQLRSGKKRHLSDDDDDDEEEGGGTDVLEVWFAGCHSDVGGGSVPNDAKHTLANVSFRWMVREVMASQCGILFDEAALVRNGIHDSAAPIMSATIMAAMKPCWTDALQPLYDQLVLNKLWWILEILPLMYYWQGADGCWHKNLRINMGRGRIIHQDCPKFHISVRERMADKKLNYSPKVTWKKGTEEYVD
ncbi:hypothetical protein APHAL10511_002741 [Amanita phalloides]|nr:hypothetical protein APHAL10511_002741 [Amanita phalloides]